MSEIREGAPEVSDITREQAVTELKELFSAQRRHVEFGGGEDEEGTLQPGEVDVDDLEQQVLAIINRIKK